MRLLKLNFKLGWVGKKRHTKDPICLSTNKYFSQLLMVSQYYLNISMSILVNKWPVYMLFPPASSVDIWVPVQTETVLTHLVQGSWTFETSVVQARSVQNQ